MLLLSQCVCLVCNYNTILHICFGKKGLQPENFTYSSRSQGNPFDLSVAMYISIVLDSLEPMKQKYDRISCSWVLVCGSFLSQIKEWNNMQQ